MGLPWVEQRVTVSPWVSMFAVELGNTSKGI